MSVDIADVFLNQLGVEGYANRIVYARIVCARHTMDLKEMIHGQRENGSIDPVFFAENLDFYDFDIPKNLTDASSLIIVAVPSPVTLVNFTLKDKIRSLPIPPTYIGYRKVMSDVEVLASKILEPSGYHVCLATLPLKLLAVCSGLGEYGRNNICYVPGLGSYHELVGLFSDLPCPQDNWQPPKMMDRCASCTICQRLCPTAAIASDRFLLRAEKCVTLHNERPGDRHFPEWIPAAAHNSIVGCMLCQELCPENRQYSKGTTVIAEFTPDETEMLINGISWDQFPTSTREKYQSLDINYPPHVLSRNVIAAFA